MNLAVMCGSYDTASLESRQENSEVISLVTNRPYTFIMGSGNTGSMRDVKEIIMEKGKTLIIVGKEEELDRSPGDVKISVETTFERLSTLYENSDAILCLSGGVGTKAEFYSFLNNNIETNNKKPLILYNADHSYDYILNDLKYGSKNGVVNSSYHHYFDVANNINDLAKILAHIEASNKIDKEKGRKK